MNHMTVMSYKLKKIRPKIMDLITNTNEYVVAINFAHCEYVDAAYYYDWILYHPMNLPTPGQSYF